MTDFCHLHVNSEYTLPDGACRVRDVAFAAAAAGQTAVALTDRGTMAGCVSFARACADAGVKPIIGCEIGFSVFDGCSGMLVLLCENAEGYSNLTRLVADYSLAGEPLRADALAGRTAGLIALCGGTEGEIFSHVSAGDFPRAVETARKYKALFGQANFYVELENHLLPSETGSAAMAARAAAAAGVGCVASNRVKFIGAEDAEVRDALTSFRTGTPISDVVPSSPEYRFKTGDEMAELFSQFPEAVANTVIIAGRCNFSFDFSARLLPSFPLPEGANARDELLSLAGEGLGRLMQAGLIPAPGRTLDEYADRLAGELDVISRMGFDDYFLIVADYVGAAKKAGISVGPGRGSGCGSLVAYCTGITEVDPVKYGLYFERFLNPDRVSMPDIDVDFDSLRRDDVIEYLKGRYGADRVARISAYGTFAPKAALRDACRAFGMTPQATDAVCSKLPDDAGRGIAGMLKAGLLGDIASYSETAAAALRAASLVEGYVRGVSVHAAGVVITGSPAAEVLPLFAGKEGLVTQYDMNDVASLGFLKFDFLALRYLTLIETASRTVREKEPGFDVSKVSLDSPEAYRLISDGLTLGVFQLEKEGITSLARRMRPESLEDLAAAIALYRPGPVDSIPKYLAGRRNPGSVVYPHPLLEEILKPTYGCIVYQEQVISIFRTLAGYTAGHADLVRRAMSKKDASALAEERGAFVSGAGERGMSADAAGRLFDDMASFAGYAFNRSHAVAYAMITFRTAYIKAKYPAHYIAALADGWASDRLPELAAEASKLGTPFLPPDVNLSVEGPSPCETGIRFGLAALRGCGPRFSSSVVAERENGPYKSFEDFLFRSDRRDVGRRGVYSAIMAGAFDFCGRTRAALVAELDAEWPENGRAPDVDGQLDMFSAAGDREAEKKPDPAEYPEDFLEKEEIAACGLSFRRASARRKEDEKNTSASGNESREEKKPEPPKDRGDAVRKSGAETSGEARRQPKRGILFVRVPSKESREYRKCDNLAGIFDGAMPLYYFFSDSGKYEQAAAGVDGSEALLSALSDVCGTDSVVVK